MNSILTFIFFRFYITNINNTLMILNKFIKSSIRCQNAFSTAARSFYKLPVLNERIIL